MDILIKNTKMPVNCYECYLLDRDCYCAPLDEPVPLNHVREGRLPECPLIAVPPHGRLIDADAITNYHLKGTIKAPDGNIWVNKEVVVIPISSLGALPTVLTASR